jgi:hypothetical protein
MLGWSVEARTRGASGDALLTFSCEKDLTELCSFVGKQGKEFFLVERRKLQSKGGQTPKEQGMLLFVRLLSDLEKKKVEARCGRWGHSITQLTGRRTRGLPVTFSSALLVIQAYG